MSTGNFPCFLYVSERRQPIQQPNYYSILPVSVRYCKEITGDEKLLFSELTCLANKLGYCYASNKYFSNLYGVTTRTIISRLAKLQQYGFIKIIIDRNDKNEVVGIRIYLQDLPEIKVLEDKPVHTPTESNFDTPIEKTMHTCQWRNKNV
ncbi:MAG: helix-turn-helix domain-containing protein [Candidatus Delongbacteria bacterium]|nr:helix-turn-helix domain-containing protein [Candidatus Delongbacteria bacterium]